MTTKSRSEKNEVSPRARRGNLPGLALSTLDSDKADQSFVTNGGDNGLDHHQVRNIAAIGELVASDPTIVAWPPGQMAAHVGGWTSAIGSALLSAVPVASNIWPDRFLAARLSS